MAFIQPLDFMNLLVVFVIGSPVLFGFISLIVIAAASAYFRMPDLVFGILAAIYVIFMAAYNPGLYLLVIIASGLAIFYAIGQFIKR